MSRTPVQVRDATPQDAPALLTVWGEGSARVGSDRHPATPTVPEAAAAIARTTASPDERLIVAVVDQEVVGAAHLVRAPISPLSSEMSINVTHLRVREEARRRGAGRALMEAAVTWAEEKDTDHVLAAVSAHVRDANRFMARLGLAQVAVVRGAAVPALRAKLPVEPPVAARVGSLNRRSVGQVLAQRRSLRRARSKTP